MKQIIRKLLHLRPDLSISFYVVDFIFRRILRQNAKVKWAVHHTATIRNPEKLTIGKYTYPGDSPGVYISAINGVEIGDYTNLGPGVNIISDNHNFIDNNISDFAQPIKIGNFCWLGSNAVVLPAVCLGDFTIVGAGTIVTKSFVEGYCVIAGNPAKIIKQLDKATCVSFAQFKEK